jgi:hypothetical protein
MNDIGVIWFKENFQFACFNCGQPLRVDVIDEREGEILGEIEGKEKVSEKGEIHYLCNECAKGGK